MLKKHQISQDYHFTSQLPDLKKEKFDYVISAGVLSLKLNTPDNIWQKYCENLIIELWKIIK